MCRKINLIVLHCTDTRPSTDYTVKRLQHDHKQNGFGQYPGYHFYIRRDGTLYYTRPLAIKGCHVAGHNANSIGICTEGGHREQEVVLLANIKDQMANIKDQITNIKDQMADTKEKVSKYEDNRTAEQKVVQHELLTLLHEYFPEAKIVGHHDLNPLKACPCYDAKREYAYIF